MRASAIAGLLFALTMAACLDDGIDDCVKAKRFMCDRIPDAQCSAIPMESEKARVVDACGQAELDAYIPELQSACLTDTHYLDCREIAAKDYAPEGGGD